MELEPDGGNLYKPHQFQIHSGRFWRCKHGRTGFGSGMVWKGCWRCALRSPINALKWRFKNG